MSVFVDIDDAAERLEDLIARVEAGERVYLTRDGKPVVSIDLAQPPATTDGPADYRVGTGVSPR